MLYRLGADPTPRRGELFAADSSGVIVLGARLVRVRWARLASLDVEGMGSSVDIEMGASASRDKKERLALVSRFPQGLDGLLLMRVLARLGQETLDELP